MAPVDSHASPDVARTPDSMDAYPGLFPVAADGARRRVTIRDLAEAKVAGVKWPMLTAYDYLSAGIFDEANVPVLLIGDSAGMVVFGYDSTVPVTIDELLPLVRAVVRGAPHALVVADLTFGSYQGSVAAALDSAGRMLKDGHAHAVKLEGGLRIVPQVEALVAAGIPVMGHLGLTPQSVNVFGGYRVQGRGEAGDILIRDAKALEAAGAFSIVLEVIPPDLAARVTSELTIPTIGIGAGPHVDAQVLVWQDMVGLTLSPAKFVKQYANMRGTLGAAADQFAREVLTGVYPDAQHSYK